MTDRKFCDLSDQEQRDEVHKRFVFRENAGWFTPEGIFAGLTEEDVTAALLDLEEAEINAIGDCMGGCSMIEPRLENFVRQPGDGKTGQ